MRHLRHLVAFAVVALGAAAAAGQEQPAAGTQPQAEPQGIVPQPLAAQPQAGAVVPPALPQAVVPPPLPAPPAQTVYFVEQNGQPVGPLTMDDLKARVAAGSLKGDTLVWKQGSPAWAAAKDVAEVAALLPVAPPPVPAAEQYRRLLVGTWQVQQTNNLGFSSTSTYTYNADGTYSGVVIQTFQGLTIPMPETGTWSAQAVSPGTFSLTMTQNAAAGFGGIAGAGALVPVTAVLRVVDNNTLANDAAGYQARRLR